MLVLTYEQLVGETERTMRGVAERVGISWSPVLVVPTFNGRPTLANSHRAVERRGVLPGAGDRLPRLARRTRRSGDRATLAGDLYERAELAAA